MTRRFCFLAIVSVFVLIVSPLHGQVAEGLGVNIPVVGRVQGSTLFITSLDVTNHTQTESQVDFYFTGKDQVTAELFSIIGGIADSGIVQRGTGTLSGFGNAHFDDFIDALATAGLITQTARNNGVMGSVLFVFDGLATGGQGSAQARFYNALSGGTAGVSAKGREVTTNEPQKLVAVAFDNRGAAGGAPEVYPNMFINNTGLMTDGGQGGGPVTVRVTAYRPVTREVIGVPRDIPIAPGETASLSQVLNQLQVPAGTTTAIVRAEVIAGDAAIQGLMVQVDSVTRDGSAVDMSRADF